MNKKPNLEGQPDRHIYNNSTCAWKIQAVDPQIGNVWFGLPDGTWIENGPITIPAGAPGASSVVTMTYTTTGGQDQGTFIITDSTGNSKQFLYMGLYINHDGSTGGASLNDPADGDISIGSCTW